MIPSSVRRAATVAPQAVLTSAKGATASAPSFVRGHQRRCSSSKPSRSDNGANDITASQPVTASSTSGRSDAKASSDKRKRKGKDGADAAASFKKLPSVPSTHHMSKTALGLSSFFSLHRPISVTQTMPRSVTDEHFASIFAPRAKAAKISETMSTLSETIDSLDGPMAQMTIGQVDNSDMGDGGPRIEIHNADGSDASIHLQVNHMSGEFLPFRPPPLPQPEGDTESSGMFTDSEGSVEAPMHRSYQAMFTIEESTESSGQIRIVAHSPRIVDEDQPRSFLERLAQRQLKFDQAQGRRDMHALSVKRIRKLKMKKKKYKKLMRRTRNLRRKLDRT